MVKKLMTLMLALVMVLCMVQSAVASSLPGGNTTGGNITIDVGSAVENTEIKEVTIPTSALTSVAAAAASETDHRGAGQSRSPSLKKERIYDS